MICLELNWLFYDPSWMLQLSEFVWTLPSSSQWVVFFTIFSLWTQQRDQTRLFFGVTLNPLLFFANTPFNYKKTSRWKKATHAESFSTMMRKMFIILQISIIKQKVVFCLSNVISCNATRWILKELSFFLHKLWCFNVNISAIQCRKP